jgi:RalA-binding protein 1
LIDSSARVAELARLVSELPPPNYALLRSLTAHLILIVKHSSTNKMTLRNIGIVFSPTLGIPAGIFSELVSHFGAIFDAEEEVPEPAEAVVEISAQPPSASDPIDERSGLRPINEDADNTMKRNRNSVLYQAAGADAMLGIGGRSLDPSELSSCGISLLTTDR